MRVWRASGQTGIRKSSEKLKKRHMSTCLTGAFATLRETKSRAKVRRCGLMSDDLESRMKVRKQREAR